MAGREVERHSPPALLQSQLPCRLARLRRRAQRLQDGWDVNTLSLLGEDAGFLAAALRECGPDDLVDALAELDAAIAPLLDPPRPPDQAGMARIAARIEALPQLDARARTDVDTASDNDLLTDENGFLPLVTPPPDYWQRFAKAPEAPVEPVAAPVQAPSIVVAGEATLDALIAAVDAYVDPRAGEQVVEADAAPPRNLVPDFSEHFSPVPEESLAPELRAVTEPPGDDLAERLRIALDRNAAELAFQAIVPLHGEAREQFQVLLRLRDGDGRVHTAAELIPVAERAGLLGAVDRWVLERSIALAAQSAQARRALRLFVSQTLTSARNAWAATRIERLLGEYKIAAPAIWLELRADEADSATADVVRYANAVRRLGCGFVLSGFEAGERSERLLDVLPVDAVRLSPRHLQLSDAAEREELRELVERLHERGRRVIAPRVEDARAASALWAAGVDYVQGNFVQPADSDFGFDFRGSTA
ncbi:EAL domain-containing protein [Dokdonella sp.]|uniref:EAL domain-containing protein n=1 Tax=Dokdonella sp. TaxID=2291710 RepID=UPI001B21BFDD|nr:EAL domain-containing protein [Dokdonella sp.]MBO9664374.1 EAL domain-containing protein [Dokdonella sp.]